MTAPTDVTFVDNTTPVISAEWLNGINDWVYPMYNAGTCVFGGVTVTVVGTNGTTITLPSTTGTLAKAGANTDITSVTLAGLCDLSNAAAGQIKFPATQNPSADVNTLDDYEEGTFTPTMVGSTGGTTTYTNQQGVYTKIGRLVTIKLYVSWSNIAGATGSYQLGGLPFPQASTTNGQVPLSLVPDSGITYTADSSISCLTIIGSSTATFYQHPRGGAAIPIPAATGAGGCWICGTYETTT